MPEEMMDPEPEPQLVIIENPIQTLTFIDNETKYDSNINGAAYSSNGKYIAGSGYKIVWLWDASNANLVRLFEGHLDHLWVTAFTSDSKILASACDDNTIGLWDVETGMNLHFLEGHTDDVRSVSISPDDMTVASASIVW